MGSFGQELAAARDGDTAALQQLFAECLPDVAGLVRRHADGWLLARESSADLAQTVCREVLQGLADFRGADRAAFRAWLGVVVKNKILQRCRHYRQHKRDIGRERSLEPIADTGSAEAALAAYSSSGTPSAQAMRREDVERLERALAQLPDDYLQIIRLVEFDKRSGAEAASLLGRSEPATRQLLHRAKARLAQLLWRDRNEEHGAQQNG